MFRKALSVLLVLIMTIIPMASLAENATTNSSTFKISNPKFSISGIGEYDLTGLELLLSTATDATDAENFGAMVALQLLGNGNEALGGMIVMDNEKAAAVLNGLSTAFLVKYEELAADAGIDTAEFADLLEMSMASVQTLDEDELEAKLEAKMEALVLKMLSEPEEVEVEYKGETVSAKKMTMTMDKNDVIDVYKMMFEAYGLDGAEFISLMETETEDMNMTMDVYEINETTAFSEGIMTMTVEDETVYMKFEMDVTIPEDSSSVTMDGAMYILETEDQPIDEAEAMITFSANTVEGAAFEDSIEMTMTMNIIEYDEEIGTVNVEIKPNPVEEGFSYNFGFNMSMEDEVMEVTGEVSLVGEDVVLSMDASMVEYEEETNHMTFELKGKYVEGENEEKFDGTLGLAVTTYGDTVTFSTDISFASSDSVEGKIPSIDSLKTLNVMDMTEKQATDLTNEASVLMMGVLGKMGDVPGFMQLMVDMMNGFSTDVDTGATLEAPAEDVPVEAEDAA